MATIAEFMTIEAQNEATLQRGKAHLLVVEPNAAVREQISCVLSEKFKIIFALNGRQALDILQKHSVQAIISETKLAVLDGINLLKTLRESSTLQAIPFIVLSEESNTGIKIEFLESGASDFVQKPFSPQELAARVGNITRMRRYQLNLEEGLAAARIIQHSLMPPARVEFGKASFEFLYQPCDHLSGDFLDIIEHGQKVYIYVADVTSHGTASAQVTYLLKGLFREAAGRADAGSLSDILRRVGEGYVALKLEFSIGIRAFEFHKDTHQLSVAGSNSPDPLIFNGGNLRSVIRGDGPVLDPEMWSNEPFTIETVQLQSGDTVYVFSDGCVEFTASDGAQVGFKRFTALLGQANPQTWRTTVMDALVKLQGNAKFDDDITIGRLQV